MESEIIALAHCCKELFLIMDMTNILGETVGLIIIDTAMNVYIYEDNYGALIMEETLPPQFNPQKRHYSSKTTWFCE